MDDRPTDNRRERRIAERKATILAAAAQLFAEKGYQRTTTKEIAEAAGISEGTIYNYFNSKDELLLGLMMQTARRFELDRQLGSSLPQDPKAFLAALLRRRNQMNRESGDALKVMVMEILVNPDLKAQYNQHLLQPAYHLIEEHLRLRMEEGQIAAGNVPLTARVLTSLFLGLFMLYAMGDPLVEAEMERLPDFVADLLFGGLDRPHEPVQPGD
jgi:AcrR family transcriptional regulator